MCTLAACDVWYTIGSPNSHRWLDVVARLLRKPRVTHWVGSDIAALRENVALKADLERRNIVHLAEVEWTAGQLRALGFAPRIAPLPPRHLSSHAKPLPQTFTIMLYVPRTRAAFYGVRAFERLMAALQPEPVRYIVVGGGEIDAPAGVEVENLGWRHNLDDIYERSTVLIRYTPRDGLSLMVLEALAFGRHVLWTQDFPFTRTVHSYGEMEAQIRTLLAAHLRGELQPQSDAAKVVARRYDPKACTMTIARAWADASKGPVPPDPHLAAEAS
jgi:glycosyltransferase involved in cell wall biosynthesis